MLYVLIRRDGLRNASTHHCVLEWRKLFNQKLAEFPIRGEEKRRTGGTERGSATTLYQEIDKVSEILRVGSIQATVIHTLGRDVSFELTCCSNVPLESQSVWCSVPVCIGAPRHRRVGWVLFTDMGVLHMINDTLIHYISVGLKDSSVWKRWSDSNIRMMSILQGNSHSAAEWETWEIWNGTLGFHSNRQTLYASNFCEELILEAVPGRSLQCQHSHTRLVQKSL